MANLDPQLLAQILSGQGPSDYQLVSGSPGSGWTGGESGYATPWANRQMIYGPTDGGSWSVQSNPVYDTQGNYLGMSSGDSDNLAIAKFIATSLAAYGGASAMGGADPSVIDAYGAASGYGGDTLSAMGMGTGADAATSAAWGSGAGLGGDTLSAMGAGGGAAGAGTAGTAGTAAGTSAAGGGLWDAVKAGGGAVVDALGGSKGTGALLGAAAGALSSKDQTQTSTRDPWSKAQPFLEQQLAQGSQLSNKYAAQPFSAAQQNAYGNVGGLLDYINGNAGGLMANAGAVGQNQFRRGMYQPTQFQGIGAPQGYGLLGNFGTKG